MGSIGRFLLRRIIAIPVTFLIITMVLYGVIMLAPLESRIQLYMPDSPMVGRNIELTERLKSRIIEQYQLDKPFFVQYYVWISNIFKGNWGYSPVLEDNVLPQLLRRTPVTSELLFYTMLLNIPLGLIAGVQAAYKRGRLQDILFRFTAFLGTSIPDFIISLILIGTFYVGLGWFAPNRLGIMSDLFIRSDEFRTITGFVTIDGFLNNRSDISIEAFQHLAMPVFTLAFAQWATLGRITRTATIEEVHKDYITSARARGLSENRIIWKHAFMNALGPALNSSGLSTAIVFSNIFVVERIFNLNGISEIITKYGPLMPDAAGVLGVGVYSVILVQLIMLLLDLLQAILLPRTQEGTINNE